MTLEQLKSNAYDALVQVEAWQNKLKVINQEIATYKSESSGTESIVATSEVTGTK